MESQLEIKLYGGLRAYADTPCVMVEVALPQTSDVIKEALRTRLKKGAEELIKHCALATDSHILSANDMVKQGDILSALPPVCGG